MSSRQLLTGLITCVPAASLLSWNTCRLYNRYTLVARKGAAPLFWGVDDGNGDNVIISTMPAYLSSFPAGCAFEVRAHSCCGITNDLIVLLMLRDVYFLGSN